VISEETIFALASGAGRAGIAVLRLSGPAAISTLIQLCGDRTYPPRLACRVKVNWAGEVLDDGLALVFPAPQSFTGEDVVELHLHGGRAVIEAVSEALVACGLRPAEPGEFSRRAFLNDKLDLTRAEAIADLVDAETAAQRRQALRQMDGALARLYDGWREDLVHAIAYLEATIDFSDEDLPDSLDDVAGRAIGLLRQAIAAHLADGHRGERVRDGLQIAILGAPNAGKSSLLNRLSGREAAIVSAKAGTTRDVIEVHLDLLGYPVILADTAGLREAAEEIEEEGIRRALARAEGADLVIAVFDGQSLPDLDSQTLSVIESDSLVVINKADCLSSPLPSLAGHSPLALSAKTGEGMEALLDRLGQWAAAKMDNQGAPPLTRARHRAALEETLKALDRAAGERESELRAEDMRLAARALGRITGRVDVEDVLDVIFRDFCIGK